MLVHTVHRALYPEVPGCFFPSLPMALLPGQSFLPAFSLPCRDSTSVELQTHMWSFCWGLETMAVCRAGLWREEARTTALLRLQLRLGRVHLEPRAAATQAQNKKAPARSAATREHQQRIPMVNVDRHDRAKRGADPHAKADQMRTRILTRFRILDCRSGESECRYRQPLSDNKEPSIEDALASGYELQALWIWPWSPVRPPAAAHRERGSKNLRSRHPFSPLRWRRGAAQVLRKSSCAGHGGHCSAFASGPGQAVLPRERDQLLSGEGSVKLL